MISFEEAQNFIKSVSYEFEKELIPLENSLGRFLAEDIFTDRDYPPFNRASMDGYALKFQDYQANEIRIYNVVQHVHAGQKSTIKIKSGECYKIMTGAAVPHFADMIIRVEDSQEIEKNTIKLSAENPKTFQNIAKRGEDKKKNTCILKKGTQINQAAFAALAVVGKAHVLVFKNPTLAIVSTGNEIKKVSEIVNEVEIRDSNTYAIRASFEKYKIKPFLISHSSDNHIEISEVLSKALAYNIVVVSGGVSAGDADFVPQVLVDLGVKKIFHKVKIKPGKPIWFGITETNTVVFALPGNPLSVQVACKIFIEYFLLLGFKNSTSLFVEVPILEERIKKNTLDEFLVCQLKYGNTLGVSITKSNGSGDISASIDTDGFFLHPAEKNALQLGDLVRFFRW